MYVHPHSLSHNAVDFMPEIFTDNKVDFMHFCIALSMFKLGRTDDYFNSGSFLFGSQKTKDINMLFSAVQRCFGYKHKDFQSYIISKPVRAKLLGITDSKVMSNTIEKIAEEYNAKYGMRHQIHDFYVQNLSDESKQTLLSGIIVPAYYYPLAEDQDTGIKQRLDFLLKIRNGHDHAATYHPLSVQEEYLEHIRVVKGQKEYTFLVRLTFEQLYEITRKAMAAFWLREYRSVLKSVGKAEVDNVVAKHKAETKRMNEERKKAGLIP